MKTIDLYARPYVTYPCCPDCGYPMRQGGIVRKKVNTGLFSSKQVSFDVANCENCGHQEEIPIKTSDVMNLWQVQYHRTNEVAEGVNEKNDRQDTCKDQEIAA